MRDSIKKMLLSPNIEDKIIGIKLLKAESKDWYEFFSVLVDITGYHNVFYTWSRGPALGGSRPIFTAEELIKDIPFKIEEDDR